MIVIHERLINLAIPYRYILKIAGGKGFTLSPDIVREVRSSLAITCFSSGIQVAWPTYFRSTPRFVFGSGTRRQFEGFGAMRMCAPPNGSCEIHREHLRAPVYMMINKHPSRSRCKAVVLRT